MTSSSGIVLVCMPFGHVFSPSIALGLLKAELAEQGLTADVRYFSIRFAELVGQAFYYGVSCEGRPSIQDLAGEWIFSGALFRNRVDEREYIDEVLRRRFRRGTRRPSPAASPALIRRIERARQRVDGFLEWCQEEVVRVRPKLVGFTSMFQQHVASLALAQRIKEALPETFIVFGGANCEDVMGAETVRQFPFVDAAVSGDADHVFPELARRVLEDRPVTALPGVRTRGQIEAEFASGRFSQAVMVRNLDALPYPDYSDYFEQFKASRFGRAWRPSVYVETSRGCWWGEKMHCTFCGLNGQTMAFRSKSAQRAIQELDHMARQHPGCRIEMTDNILDMGYFKDFVPALAVRPSRPRLFYEVKANLKKEQLKLLREAGIRRIQPGIESLSDRVLALMRKGVSALQNIQLLKWCKELGLKPSWNLIWGFPGEPAEEYRRMAALVPWLSHLQPPYSQGPIRLDRFSPNFDRSDQLGFKDVKPLPPYRYIYPLPDEIVANLAYFFTFDYREPRDVEGYVSELDDQVSAWQKAWPRQDLFSVDMGDCLLVWDLRSVSRRPLTVLRGAERVLYQRCDCATDLGQLAECLSRSDEVAPSAAAIEDRLEPLAEHGLVVRDGPRYLALAVPLGEYSPPPPAVDRLYEVARSIGRRTTGGWVVAREEVHQPRRHGADRSPALRPRRATAEGRAFRLTTSHFSTNDRGEVLVRRLSNR